MSGRRREFLQLPLIVAAFAAVDVHAGRSDEPPGTAVDAVLARGVEWLVAQQHTDGAWRSAVYSQLDAGPAATAHAVAALASVAAAVPEDAATVAAVRSAVNRALPYLLPRLLPAGAASSDPADDAQENVAEYPNYAAALTLIAFERLPAAQRAQHEATVERLRAYLVAAQASAPIPKNIATESDVGGWGLVGGEPIDPSSFRTPNVSTTRYALAALAPAAAQHPETFRRARQFLARRQNADGGFAFVSDPLDQLNKAGVIDPSAPGASFAPRSYGTATVDGLLAMRAAGVDANSPQPTAAVRWLDAHPQVDRVPGFPSDEVSTAMSAGLFYYYAAALSQAMVQFPEASFARRRPALAAELAGRQRPDGSWANRIPTMREDDPLTAACFAIEALAALSAP